MIIETSRTDVDSIEREAVPIAHEAIHERVVHILDALPRGRALDVPAGEGALAARLKQIGFELHCCDLYPQIFRLKDVEIRHGDLSISLPYFDEEFDYVICLEGLEHIENPQQAVREFRRILKPHGHLIVSTPNVLNIEERFKWLLFGYTSHFKPISRAYLANLRNNFKDMEEIALHVNPIAYTELRYTLEEYGFEIQRLYRDKPKSNIWLYYPFVWLIRLINRFTSGEKRRERWTDELQSDEVLLGGNTLIVHAVKK